MNATLLRQIYKQHHISKKKIKWAKTQKVPDPEKTKQQLTTMKRQLTMARNDGYRLVYIDETCFTRKTLSDTEWARSKENMTVDQAKLDELTLALLCGISKENGVEHFEIFEQSVNVEKFKQYLDGLHESTVG